MDSCITRTSQIISNRVDLTTTLQLKRLKVRGISPCGTVQLIKATNEYIAHQVNFLALLVDGLTKSRWLMAHLLFEKDHTLCLLINTCFQTPLLSFHMLLVFSWPITSLASICPSSDGCWTDTGGGACLANVSVVGGTSSISLSATPPEDDPPSLCLSNVCSR